MPLALYGKPYIAAAKDTWRLFKDRGRLVCVAIDAFAHTWLGIDALVNDSLVGMSKTSTCISL